MNHRMLEFSEFLSKLEDELEAIAASGRQSPRCLLKGLFAVSRIKVLFYQDIFDSGSI